jgi:trafficking protein particle complex subunit 11
VNWIVVEDTRSSSLIKGIQLGALAPGVTGVKTLHLFNTGASGDRMIDISIQSRTVIAGKHESDHAEEDEDDEDFDGETSSDDSMEHLHMLVIPTTNPFKLSHSVFYRHALDSWPGLANLETFDQTFWDDRRGGEALVAATLSCVGPSSLNIESLRLERQVSAMPRSSNS